jgi:hypothetical protein
MREIMRLEGKKFGRLTVVSYSHQNDKGSHVWNCECACGGRKQKTTSQLRDRHATNQSCGCSKVESIAKASKAGWTATTKFSHPLKLKVKWLWKNMMKRCYNPNDRRYSDYGGRGIVVCDEWRNDRYSFYHWCISNRCEWALQIDRKNNDGPYSPENCKFSTRIEQANNTRKNRFLTWNGETRTIAQWERHIGLYRGAINSRVNHGWTGDRIFTQKMRGK